MFSKILSKSHNHLLRPFQTVPQRSLSGTAPQIDDLYNHPQRIHGPSSLVNPTIRGLGISPTVAMNDLQRQLISQGKTVYKFGFGQSPFPVPSKMVNSLVQNAFVKDYLPVRGLMDLRTAIAGHITKERPNTDYKAENVLTCPGSKEGLFLLQLSYMAQVIVPAPSWVSYRPQAEIIGRSFKYIPTFKEDSYKITPKNLRELISEDPDCPRILTINAPNNPTGMAYSHEELEGIAEICKKYRVLVVSDEIYSPIMHLKRDEQNGGQISSPGCPSIASIYPEGTIIMTGISKWAGAGGWRCGALIFPSQLTWLMDAVAVVASETFTSTSAPIQHGAVPGFAEFESNEIQSYLDTSRKVYTGLAQFVCKELRSMGATLPTPDGSFYTFPDFGTIPDIRPKLEIQYKKTGGQGDFTCKDMSLMLLRDIGFGGLSGDCFGRDPKELTMRLAYVDFDGADILGSPKNEIPEDPFSPEMSQFLERKCPKVFAGFRALSDYFRSL